MRISFTPQRRDDTLTLELTAPDRIRINGDLFNFGPLNEGDVLPEVPCEWIVGPVVRQDGEIHLTLILPHGPNPSQAVAFPQPIVVTEDGPVAVPEGSDPVTPMAVRTDEEYEADRQKYKGLFADGVDPDWDDYGDEGEF